jgi:type IV fimbrial biogenesis protein FimT
MLVTGRTTMPKRPQRGFSLIELMVVVTIAAVMLGVAIPSFREFTAGQRVKNTAFDFAAALLLARSEAIKRNTPVTLAHAGAGWAEGWTVAVGGNTLATKEAPASVTITTNPDPTVSVAYQANGRIAGTLSFQFSAANSTAVRCVAISTSGVPNTTTTSCPSP